MKTLAALFLAAALATGAAADEIDGWIDALGSEDWSEREEATTRLAKLGAKAVPQLERAAREHADLEVRHRAKKILESFTYSNPDFLATFVELGKEAIPRLSEIVARGDAAECAAAADVLGRIGGDEAFRLLATLAGHASELVKARAATALGATGDERALPILRNLVTAAAEEGSPSRLAASLALATRGDESANEPLFQALASADLRVRQTAASGLSLAFRREGKEDEIATRFRAAPDLFAKRFCLGLYAGSPSKKGAAFLMATASNPSVEEPIRREALLVLGSADFPDAGRFLAEFARHRGGALGVAAALSLGRRDAATARPLLEALAGSADGAVRDAARAALERLTKD